MEYAKILAWYVDSVQGGGGVVSGLTQALQFPNLYQLTCYKSVTPGSFTDLTSADFTPGLVLNISSRGTHLSCSRYLCRPNGLAFYLLIHLFISMMAGEELNVCTVAKQTQKRTNWKAGNNTDKIKIKKHMNTKTCIRTL